MRGLRHDHRGGWATALACAWAGANAAAQIVISVDMDPNTAGIQSVLAASVNDTITVDLVLDLGASFPAGLSIYSFSVRHDNTELTYSSATEGVVTGLSNMTLGLETKSNDIGGGLGLGQVGSFEGYTLSLGPTSGSYIVGNITYTVAAVSNDGLPDVTPGVFAQGIDGFYDNSNNDILASVTFNPGYVVPEPVSTGVAMGGVALLTAILLRRRTR